MLRVSHLFAAGCYVEVAPNTAPGCNSEGGIGWIKKVNGTNGTHDVQYVIQKKLSKNVKQSRITLKHALDNQKRKSSCGNNENAMPSLLSPSYPTAKKIADGTKITQPIKPKRRKVGNTTEDLLLMQPIDTCDYLKKKNAVNQRGWIGAPPEIMSCLSSAFATLFPHGSVGSASSAVVAAVSAMVVDCVTGGKASTRSK